MRIPRRGLLPLDCTLVAARLGVIGLTAVVSGCAANHAPSYVNGPQATVQAQRLASVAKEDLEDDGKPAQVPPLLRAVPAEDDPSQPWSPNYGGPTATPGAPSHHTPRVAPKSRAKTYDASADPTTTASVHMTRAEEDYIIARAISAHEMRNQ
jgi:hypothetical protein